MKRFYILFLLLSIGMGVFSQEITVRFTGQLNGTSYCRLDSVAVTNLTRDWTETVEYPDTIIVLGGTVGTNLNIAATQGLGQNIPNPFDCETRVELSVSQRENVRMQLLDASGRQYADYSGSLDAGVHTFDISAANPQTYILNAVVGDRSYSIRMVNMGSGCGSSIKYTGISGSITAKLTTANEFQNGDNMHYIGYVTIGSEVVASNVVEQPQTASEDITLNFSYCQPLAEQVEVTACNSYDWNNETYTESGDYQQTFVAANGCDSVVTLHLTINHSNTGIDEQTACDSYTWIDGVTYTESTNEPTFTLTDAAGCDSVVTLHLTINHSNTGIDEQTACDSYTWIDGVTYIESTNEPTFTLTNAAGCDSVVTLHLTINRSNTGIDEQTACDSYTWIDGVTYTASTNEPTFTLTNAAGCDSVVTLHLTINHSNTGIDEQTACESYTWIDQITYTESTNEPTFTLTNAAGCDSVVTLHLTINRSNTGIDEQTACDNYTWIDGITYTESTTEPTFTLTNVAGCDSVVTLHLTINHSNTGIDEQTACDNYTWIDGITYTESTTEPTFTLTNAAGCDSVVTLHLTINHSNTGIDEQTACNSYTWIDGVTYTASTNEPTFTLTNAAGCDSIVTLHLTMVCPPTVQTDAATGITTTGAILNGNVTSDGGATVTERGFMYNTSEFMLNFGNGTTTVQCGSGAGNFTANLTGLISGTTYYYKAYATNNVGTAYGEVRSFTTVTYPHVYANLGLPSGTCWATCNVGANTSEDYGNYYAWGETTTKDEYDLFTYRYCDGSFLLTKYTGSDDLTTLQSSDDAATVNWGTGWRMPTPTEISELYQYCTVTWTSQNGVNGNLFTGPNGNSIFLPAAGYRGGRILLNAGSSGYYWSNKLYPIDPANAFYLDIISGGHCEYRSRVAGRSVRPVCVSPYLNTPSYSVTFDANGGTGTMQPQTFTAGEAQNLTTNTFTRENYTFAGWNTVADGSGAAYTDGQSITATENMTLYAQWEESRFGSFTDTRDGNTYSTVRIGNQTWMAENLRYVGNVPMGSMASSAVAYRYYPSNNSSNVSTYGYLYNWTAAMNGSSSSSANPSGVQGICPNGWHLPSSEEWTQLGTALDNTNVGPKLAGSAELWTSGTLNGNSSFGTSGFNALPSGTFMTNQYTGFGESTYFWSATENDSDNALGRSIRYNSTGCSVLMAAKQQGNSIRCVRND